MKITQIAMRWLQFKTDMWFYNTFNAIEDAIRKNTDRIGGIANRSHRNEKRFIRVERRLLAIETKLGMRTDVADTDESAKLLKSKVTDTVVDPVDDNGNVI